VAADFLYREAAAFMSPHIAAPRGAPCVIVSPCIRYGEGVSQGRWATGYYRRHL